VLKISFPDAEKTVCIAMEMSFPFEVEFAAVTKRLKQPLGVPERRSVFSAQLPLKVMKAMSALGWHRSSDQNRRMSGLSPILTDAARFMNVGY